jgi:hypothetical protein
MIKRRVLSLLILCLLGVGPSFCASMTNQKRIDAKKASISALEEKSDKLQTMQQHNLIAGRDNNILTQTRILNLINDILKISPSERKNLKNSLKRAQANLKVEIGFKNNEIISLTNEIARLKALAFNAPHKRDLELTRKSNIDTINKKIGILKEDITTMKKFLY